MRFLQWLYNYANKSGPVKVKVYKGYERRMEALCKQRGKLKMHFNRINKRNYF